MAESGNAEMTTTDASAGKLEAVDKVLNYLGLKSDIPRDRRETIKKDVKIYIAGIIILAKLTPCLDLLCILLLNFACIDKKEGRTPEKCVSYLNNHAIVITRNALHDSCM